MYKYNLDTLQIRLTTIGARYRLHRLHTSLWLGGFCVQKRQKPVWFGFASALLVAAKSQVPNQGRYVSACANHPSSNRTLAIPSCHCPLVISYQALVFDGSMVSALKLCSQDTRMVSWYEDFILAIICKMFLRIWWGQLHLIDAD